MRYKDRCISKPRYTFRMYLNPCVFHLMWNIRAWVLNSFPFLLAIERAIFTNFALSLQLPTLLPMMFMRLCYPMEGVIGREHRQLQGEREVYVVFLYSCFIRPKPIFSFGW